MTLAGTRKERRLLIDDILYYTIFLMHMQLYGIGFIGCFYDIVAAHSFRTIIRNNAYI
jgi:hypothetical protein